MWCNGMPAGFCDEPAYGNYIPGKTYRNAWSGERQRIDGRYAGYVPALACKHHGGPDTPNPALAGVERADGQGNPIRDRAGSGADAASSEVIDEIADARGPVAALAAESMRVSFGGHRPMRNSMEWHVQTSLMTDSVDVWALRRFDDGRREHVAATLTVHTYSKGELAEGGPTLRFSQEEAQQLLNGLWHAGFRPRDGAGSLAHVEAQKAHLEDMRRLVFDGSPQKDPSR